MDAGAHLADLVGGFENFDAVAGEEARDGGTEATEAGTDDNDLSGFLLEGDIVWFLGGLKSEGREG